MQFAGIGERGPTVAADFCGPGFAGVPSPGEAQFPRPAVTTEERAKRAELEPAQIKFGSEFLRGNKTANVRAPIGNAGESGVDANGNMGLQSFPGRVNIAGPE